MNKYQKNPSGSWWGRFGKIAVGGNSPEAVKSIRKTAFGIVIPLACIIAMIELGVHTGKKFIDKRFKDDDNRNTGDDENPQSPSPIDEEKRAKEEDRRVKNHICEILGLLNPAPPKPTPLNSNIEDCSGTYKPQPLVGTLIKIGDRVILVGPPGSGKSALSWQLAITIALGKSPEFMPPNSEHASPQKVYIYDGELDDDDIKQRYGQQKYSDNLYRCSASKFRTVFYLLQHIYDITVGLDGDATFILDNLYAIMPTMTSEETRTFLDGLDSIQRKALDKGYRITIIIVTHSQKDVNGIPRMKDVAGSAHISRFAKSELSLAALPGDNNQVALITNKKRYSNKKDAFIIELQDTDYLHFKFVKKVSNSEIDNLFKCWVQGDDSADEGTRSDVENDDLTQRMQKLRDQNLSDREIGKRTGVSAPTVRNKIGSNGKGHHNGGRGAHKHFKKP